MNHQHNSAYSLSTSLFFNDVVVDPNRELYHSPNNGYLPYQHQHFNHALPSMRYGNEPMHDHILQQQHSPKFQNWMTEEPYPSSPKTQVLGKRPKSEESDEPKKKDLVFKGFSLEPQSKKIKFINSDRKTEGINDGAWSELEHEDFLRGLSECGHGKWRNIAEMYVKTRTRVQVASHAQVCQIL
jgi:SHAQKYF class myb-like DNA-binding protein